MEIERKFLVKTVEFAKIKDNLKSVRMEQGYIATGDHTTVRVRLSDTEAFLTIKGKTTGCSRPEYEYAIPVADAKYMLNDFCGNIVSKRRYYYASGEHVWEIDVFEGDNAGLIIAEIELSAEDEVFSPPDFIGEEVTGIRCYYNGSLAHNPYS